MLLFLQLPFIFVNRLFWSHCQQIFLSMLLLLFLRLLLLQMLLSLRFCSSSSSFSTSYSFSSFSTFPYSSSSFLSILPTCIRAPLFFPLHPVMRSTHVAVRTLEHVYNNFILFDKFIFIHGTAEIRLFVSVGIVFSTALSSYLEK